MSYDLILELQMKLRLVLLRILDMSSYVIGAKPSKQYSLYAISVSTPVILY